MGVTDSAMGRNAKACGIDGDGGYDIVEGHHYAESYIVLVINAIHGTEEHSIRMQRVSVAGGGRTRPLPSQKCIGIRRRRALATECDVLRIGVGRAVNQCSDNPFNVPCLGTHTGIELCVWQKKKAKKSGRRSAALCAKKVKRTETPMENPMRQSITNRSPPLGFSAFGWISPNYVM